MKVKYFFGTLNRGVFTRSIGLLIIITIIISLLEENLPQIEILKDAPLQVPLRIYSADAKLIAEYGEKRRTPIQLSQVPKTMIDAIIDICRADVSSAASNLCAVLLISNFNSPSINNITAPAMIAMQAEYCGDF